MSSDAPTALARRERSLMPDSLAAVGAGAWAHFLRSSGIEMKVTDMGGGQAMEILLGYGAVIVIVWDA